MQRVELRNHPAQAEDRRKGPDGEWVIVKLTEPDGTPTPLILDQHGVYYSPAEDAKFRLVGYCRKVPGRHVSLIENLSESAAGFIMDHIEKQLGGPSSLVMARPMEPVAAEVEEGPSSALILPDSVYEEEEAEIGGDA